jgi:hypothetical protein
MLRRLLLRLRLLLLRSDGFFFSVFPRDRAEWVERLVSGRPMDPEKELERCMLFVLENPGSSIELPR